MCISYSYFNFNINSDKIRNVSAEIDDLFFYYNFENKSLVIGFSILFSISYSDIDCSIR